MNGRNQDQSGFIGKKYGRLTILKARKVDNCYLFDCICDCGNRKTVRKANLLYGNVKSCGCLRREVSHGYSHTRIYNIYRGMKSRCYTKTCATYPKYGARGIGICEEWLGKDGVKNFVSWSMENGYTDELTIDRIDPQKGYSPDNCRWATYEEQNTHLSMLKTNTSGIVGVSWSNKDKRWLATVSIKNKSKRIGSFKSKEDAANARNKFIEENNLPNQKSVIRNNKELFERHTAQLSLFVD